MHVEKLNTEEVSGHLKHKSLFKDVHPNKEKQVVTTTTKHM